MVFSFAFKKDYPIGEIVGCKCYVMGFAAVKSRPVLHHCVVIFFWSSGIMECTCMKMEFCSCARGRQWCGIIHYY